MGRTVLTDDLAFVSSVVVAVYIDTQAQSRQITDAGKQHIAIADPGRDSPERFQSSKQES